MAPAGSLIFFSLVALLLVSRNAASGEIVQLGYTNAQGAKIPVFVAKEQGLFDRHGLDVRLTRVSPGTAGVPKLVAGEIHLFLGNSGPIVEAIATKQAALAVIASLGSERFAIFTRPEISRLEELKGKSFGVSTPGASQDRIASRALKKLGFEPGKDIHVVATGFSASAERLKALARGEVDAVAASPEDRAQLTLAEAAKIRRLLDLSDVGIVINGADISATRDYIRTRHETIAQFLRAIEESLRLARERPDLVAAAYQKYAGVADPRGAEAKVKEYYAGNPPIRPRPDKRGIESHLQELEEKYSDLKPRGVADYIDESWY